MKRGIAIFVGLLALSACKKTTTEQGVLVSVTNPSAIAGIIQLRVSLSNHGSTNTLHFPPNQSNAPIVFDTSFSFAVAASRDGQVDLVVEALNTSLQVVANASTSVTLEANRFAANTVALQPGPALCGNGQLDQGEPCDDGNHFSGDGCDFLCRNESVQDAAMPVDGPMAVDSALDTGGRPDVDRPSADLALVDADSVRTDTDGARDVPIGTGGIATGGAGGAAGSTGTRPPDAAVTGGNTGTGGTIPTGGSVGTGGMVETGGMGMGGIGTGGMIGTGGAGMGGIGTGGMIGTGGAGMGGIGTGGMIGTGGAIGTGGIVAVFDPTWAQWPMPNGQVDATAGAPNLSSYTDNGNGTVTDNVTGLMWQQAVAPGTYTWEQAKAYCPTLPLGGYSDWRLPSRIELVSIVDFGRRVPAINTTYFPSTPSDTFWSSSVLASTPSGAWCVSLLNGSANEGGVTVTLRARCVR